MTTFLTAVKLTYRWEDAPEYWGKCQTALFDEFNFNKTKELSHLGDYVQEKYNVNMWVFEARAEGYWDQYKTPARVITFDSEESKLMFALKFPGLPDAN